MPELMLTLTGLLPFAAGYGMHWMMTAYPDVRLPYGLIGLAFLLLWGGIAFLAGIFARRTPLLSIACMNGVALLVLVLLVIQELCWAPISAMQRESGRSFISCPCCSWGLV